jgi:hypothetical protein
MQKFAVYKKSTGETYARVRTQLAPAKYTKVTFDSGVPPLLASSLEESKFYASGAKKVAFQTHQTAGFWQMKLKDQAGVGHTKQDSPEMLTTMSHPKITEIVALAVILPD